MMIGGSMKRNDYYVYEWFIVDTGEVFYVGKGCNNRYRSTNRRNKMFNDFYSTHKTDVRKVYINLTEEEAFKKEIELIMYYRNYTSFRLTNQTDGGNLGSNYLNYKTKEEIEEIRKKQSESMKGKHDGKNNPMFGKCWHDTKTAEEIKEIYSRIAEKNRGRKVSSETRQKQSESAKNRTDENRYKAPKKPVIIVRKSDFKLVAEYDGVNDAIGNDYIKGNLSLKANGTINNPKDKYYIFYCSYNINDKEKHPKL